MTANLWSWHCDPAGLATALEQHDPDVLAVQELHWNTAPVIERHFRYHRLDPDHATLGTGIAARRAFTVERLPVTYRGGWIATLDSPTWSNLSAPVQVLNMHFANPVGWPWWQSYRVRRRQLSILTGHIETTQSAAVIAGDFNASPAWPLYRDLARRLTDAAVDADTEERTWRFRGLGRPLLRIDHVLLRGGRGVQTWTVDVPGADHLALVADVSFG